MQLFPVILAANAITLLITIVAAIKFPSWSYRLIGIVALTACVLAFHQFVTDQYHPAALWLTGISTFLITVRILINWWKFRHG